MDTPPVLLRELRDRPFDLLLAMEARGGRVAAGSRSAGGDEWVGVAFRLGSEHFLAAREETREVLAVPAHLTRVPGARLWVRGLANVRGQLLPVIDLRQFLGSGATPIQRQSRVLVVQHPVSGIRWINHGVLFQVPHLHEHGQHIEQAGHVVAAATKREARHH